MHAAGIMLPVAKGELLEAARLGKLAVIQQAVAARQNLNIADSEHGCTLLMWAALCARVGSVCGR